MAWFLLRTLLQAVQQHTCVMKVTFCWVVMKQELVLAMVCGQTRILPAMVSKVMLSHAQKDNYGGLVESK